MNILHLTPYYAPAYAFGGVPRAVEGMARALVERGHNVTVLTTDALSHSERYVGAPDVVQDGVRVVRVRNRSVALRGRLNLSTPRGMANAATPLLENADILHIHELRTAENLLVTPAAARLNIPMVLSPHGTLTLTTGRGAFKRVWDRALSPGVARRISTVIALTQAESDDTLAVWSTMNEQIAPLNVTVVPNGVNPDEFAHLQGGDAFRERFGLGDAPVCLFLGRLHARKGIDVLVRAFREANVPGSRLVIAGPDDGMLPTIQPLLDARMVVTGYLNSTERLAALAAADLFCLPATGEGLSMAALEALAAGVPVILSRGCNLPEAEEAGAGLLVEAQVTPLAMALQELLTNVERRTGMGAAGQALVRERFTWRAVAEQLEHVYERAARR